MKRQPSTNKCLFAILLIPFITGVMALNHLGFLFKAGVASSGMLILWWRYSGELGRNKDVWAIVGAFLFSIAGDWFLSNRHGETSRFIVGIALFFLAHIGYLTFGLLNGKLHVTFTLLVLATYLAFFFFALRPGINDQTLSIAVLCYLLISCFSLGAAWGITASPVFKWLYISGIALVLFSDTIIALSEFVKYKGIDYLILPTYYLAQICVTASLISRKNVVDGNTLKVL